MTIIDRARARRVVLHHARDDADAAELLAMLGLNNQHNSNARGCEGHAGRRPGRIHALSAATEARLAATAEPPAVTMPTAATAAAPPTPAPAPRPNPQPALAPAPSRSRSGEARSCAGCGKQVVPQTRYRRDPAGYRERGIGLLAAKNRCHPCYNRQRRPAAACTDEPQNPRRCKQCQRPMVSTRVFSADPDGWRARGWAAHAAHGVCRPCRSAAEEPQRRDARRAARQAPALSHLIDQLIALRRQVGIVRHSYPDDQHLAGVSTALAQARKHLDDASAHMNEGSPGTPSHGGEAG